MAWEKGQQLQKGKYTLEKKIGEGGFGITYRAKDDQGKIVVIKTLNEEIKNHPQFPKFQQDFINEAIRLAKCNHPHIVKIYEVIQEQSQWCMVMEYINGEDLATTIEKNGILSESEALRYIQQIGEALTVVHNNNLLHRDIKPHNIMLRSDRPEAVLIDFGIAREFTQNLTQNHTQFISNGFAPIEQYDFNAKRGCYTDVYALAATLYCLLTGTIPTSATLRALDLTLDSPKQFNPKISDRVNDAILKGMEFKPEDRPQTIQEWLNLLGEPLSSSSNINYQKLKELLIKQSWKEADHETLMLMLKIANREQQGWLDLEAIKTFPIEPLKIIDQLWLKYSHQQFGFTIQKQIGGNSQLNYQQWEKLGDLLGWRNNKNWIPYEKLILNSDSPKGMLPRKILSMSRDQRRERFSTLLLRLN